MREILFRGKRTNNGEWVYGYLYQYQAKLLISNEVVEHPSFSDPAGNWIYKEDEIVPETVGQFTGLLDKQGKKIFEGDIFKHETQSPFANDKPFDTEIGIVEWGIWSYMYGLKAGRPLFAFDRMKAQHVEIIGNIHDTPKQ